MSKLTKIDLLLTLISKVTGGTSPKLSDLEQDMRINNPSRLVSVLTGSYLSLCNAYNQSPASFEWLKPAIAERAKEDQDAAKWGI